MKKKLSVSIIFLSLISLAYYGFIVISAAPNSTPSNLDKKSGPVIEMPNNIPRGYVTRRLTDIPNMVNTFADIIIIGKVEKELGTKFQQSVKSPEIKLAYTNFSVVVEEIIMGSSEPTITVSAAGIVQTESILTYQFDEQVIAPTLYVGERVLLFLGRKRVLPSEDWKEDPVAEGTYVLPSSQHIYRLDGDMAHSAFYYKREIPNSLAIEYPFLIRDKQMAVKTLISMINYYVKSGDTGYGPKNKAKPYGILPSGQIAESTMTNISKEFIESTQSQGR